VVHRFVFVQSVSWTPYFQWLNLKNFLFPSTLFVFILSLVFDNYQHMARAEIFSSSCTLLSGLPPCLLLHPLGVLCLPLPPQEMAWKCHNTVRTISKMTRVQRSQNISTQISIPEISCSVSSGQAVKIPILCERGVRASELVGSRIKGGSGGARRRRVETIDCRRRMIQGAVLAIFLFVCGWMFTS
jgi:hypothetical protein